MKTIEGYKGAVWSSKSNKMALAKGNTVYIYDFNIDTLTKIHKLYSKHLTISSMHWSPTGERILLEIYTLDRNIFSLGGRYVEVVIDADSGKKLESEKIMIGDPTHWSWK